MKIPPFRLFTTIIRVIPFYLFSYVTWLFPYSIHPEKYSMLLRQRKAHDFTLYTSKKLKAHFHIEGTENIPVENCCFFSNHLAAYDPVVYLSIINDKPLTVIAKKEAYKMPFVGRVLRVLEGEFMDRKDLKQSLQVMINVQKDLEEGKRSWLIFPEGTRLKDPMKQTAEFHHGTFRNAMRAKVPLLPCVIFGSQRLLKFKLKYHSFPVFVKFLKPIRYDEYKDLTTQEIANKIHDIIAREVTYLAKKYDHEYNLKNNQKYYKFNELF